MSCDIFAVAWRSDDAIYEDYRYIKGKHISDFSKKSYRVTCGLECSDKDVFPGGPDHPAQCDGRAGYHHQGAPTSSCQSSQRANGKSVGVDSQGSLNWTKTMPLINYED